MLVSAYTFAASISSISASFFLDRYDRKAALLFFFCGFCVGTLACGLAWTYPILLSARLITGIYGGVLGTIVMSIVGDAIEPARRGSAMGIIMAAFSAASIFGVPLSVFLANKYDWHRPFYFLGLLAFGLIFVLQKNLKPMKSHLAHYVPVSAYELLKSHLWDKQQIKALTFMFALVLGQFSIIPFLSPSLVANGGMSEAQLPFIYLVGGGVSIFTSPLIGRASDKYGKVRIFTIFALLSIIPTLIITHLKITPLFLILPLIGFFFAIVGGRMVPAMAMITGIVPPERRGSFMSLVSSTQQMATALASYVAGLVVIRGNEGHLVRYNYMGYLAVVFTFVALWLVRQLTPRA
jgi:predicted MFS family arabinose efflux permease